MITYNPENFSSLESYLKRHNDTNSGAFFIGAESFNELLKRGYLLPGISVIEVIKGKEETRYDITRDLGLRNYNPSQQKEYSPEEILDSNIWEAIYIVTEDILKSLERFTPKLNRRHQQTKPATSE